MLVKTINNYNQHPEACPENNFNCEEFIMTIKQSILQRFHEAREEQNPSNVIRLYTQAIQLAQDSNSNLLAALLLCLGQKQEEVGKITDAVTTYETGYQVWAKEEGLNLNAVLSDLSAMPKGYRQSPDSDETVLLDLFLGSVIDDLPTLIEDQLLGVKLRFGIGNAYLRMGQDEPAKHALQEIMEMPELRTSDSLEARVLTHFAIILRREDKLEEAERYFDMALNLFEASPLEKRRVLTGLAGIDVEQARISKAQTKYQQALEIYQKTEVDDPIGEGRCCANLGLLLLTKEEFTEAETMLEHALLLANSTKDKDTLWWVNWGLGRCYHKRNKYEDAVTAFKKSLSLIEERHGDLRTDEGKVSFLESVQVIFDELITLYIELKDFRQALEIAERTRARSLDAMMDNNQRHRPQLKLPQFSTSPPGEEELWQALRSFVPELPEQPSVDILLPLLNLDLTVTEALNEVAPTVQKMAPAIQTDAPFPPEVWALIDNIRQPKAEDTALPQLESAPAIDIRQSAPSRPIAAVGLETFEAPSKHVSALNRLIFHVLEDRTAIFVVQTDGSVLGDSIEITRSDLIAEVNKLRQLMQVDEARETKKIGGGQATKIVATNPSSQLQHLYQLLIAPLESYLPEHGEILVIEPHDALWLLPFAALKTPNGNYVADQWRLHYTPSHEVLEEIRREHDYGAAKDQKALIIGNPTMPAMITLGDTQFRLAQLEGAQEEAESIHELFAAVTESQLLTADKATKAKVLSSIPEVGVIHFATHGVADSVSPMDSFVVLAGKDAQLSARDIINLPCRTELVVLSACQTGLGQISGEGMIGLCRAFLVAGARGVLVSQWSVSDPATRDLMIDFYKQYLSHGDKAKALQEAMQGLRQNPAYNHPRYWGAFVLFGI